MFKSLPLALAVALAASPVVAEAESALGYSYLELGHAGNDTTDIEGYAVNGSIEVGDSWFIFGHFSRGTGGFGSADVFGTGQRGTSQYFDYESDYMRLGLGYHHAINSRLDFVARAMYDRNSSETRWVPGGGYSLAYDADLDFGQLEAGLRGLVVERWDVWGYAGYDKALAADFSDIVVVPPQDPLVCPHFGDSDCGFDKEDQRYALESRVDDDFRPYARLGTRFRITETWGVSGAARFARGGHVSYFAGVRASF